MDAGLNPWIVYNGVAHVAGCGEDCEGFGVLEALKLIETGTNGATLVDAVEIGIRRSTREIWESWILKESRERHIQHRTHDGQNLLGRC